MSTTTLLWLVLLGCVVAFLGLTIRALVWVNDALGLVNEHHAAPLIPARTPDRPDVLRVPGDTDEEIIGWLVDGHFQRRGEW